MLKRFFNVLVVSVSVVYNHLQSYCVETLQTCFPFLVHFMIFAKMMRTKAWIRGNRTFFWALRIIKHKNICSFIIYLYTHSRTFLASCLSLFPCRKLRIRENERKSHIRHTIRCHHFNSFSRLFICITHTHTFRCSNFSVCFAFFAFRKVAC